MRVVGCRTGRCGLAIRLIRVARHDVARGIRERDDAPQVVGEWMLLSSPAVRLVAVTVVPCFSMMGLAPSYVSAVAMLPVIGLALLVRRPPES
jgi:hypothetical protein